MAETMKKVDVNIIEFEKHHKDDFARLNYEWLNKYFVVEDHDTEMLEDPIEYIIKPGGQILMAMVGGICVGTVALIVEDEETYELAKMAVTENFKGLRIGKMLMLAALNYSIKMGMKRVVLESNTSLTAAINLYIKTGFKALPLNPNTPYNRANIRMEMIL